MIDPTAVKARTSSFLKVPLERLGDDVPLVDLVSESFVLVQLVIELQEEFPVRLVQEDLRDVKTVGDLVRTIVTHEIAD